MNSNKKQIFLEVKLCHGRRDFRNECDLKNNYSIFCDKQMEKSQNKKIVN